MICSPVSTGVSVRGIRIWSVCPSPLFSVYFLPSNTREFSLLLLRFSSLCKGHPTTPPITKQQTTSSASADTPSSRLSLGQSQASFCFPPEVSQHRLILPPRRPVSYDDHLIADQVPCMIVIDFEAIFEPYSTPRITWQQTPSSASAKPFVDSKCCSVSNRSCTIV